MAVKYKVVSKKNPFKPDDDPKYYAAVVSRRTIKVRELAEEIARRSTLSPIDVVAMIEAMLQVIPEKLSDGYNITLGEFGTYSMSLKSRAADLPEKFNSTNIYEKRMVFRTGNFVKNKLANTGLEKVK